MTTLDGCLICGSKLLYLEKPEPMNCNACGQEYASNAKCEQGHFICDECHQKEGTDYIETVCCNSQSTDPIQLANSIMSNPKISLHGPEHHFLVPAVLLTAYYNVKGTPELIPEKLVLAKQRSKNILGGFCGFYGNCGAAVGAGIFMAIVTNCTPLSENEWKLSNLITAECLYDIAVEGGPRCCKRNTWLALRTAIKSAEDDLDVRMESSNVNCSYSKRNKECRQEDCRFFPIAPVKLTTFKVLRPK